MRASPALSRTVTIVAATALAVDGAALVALGYMTGRPVLIPVGLVFLVSSGLVVIYWRWYRRRMADISAASHALSEEARELRDSMGGQR
jgi:predicted signal transduction protein with EAL and GGDEF domain